ncbi:alpha-amylase family glycosyl hydrolase [Rubrobacter calidifluminis]|uniref:alpha-amylase family glycosyl hydrolase n=1 Tax=Rubrobacter calidifluminis TaxID=1392640 RepID=UPI00235F8007|nr:alpha-amylase family glycosyl hydrolase [Rubrobacter calidifluminis]
MNGRRRWWERGIIYQVYPRSFADSDGDVVGDLAGVIGKLDYLAWLGVDAVWLSPIYPSPMADFGYDISCYTDVDPLFGTLEDFDRLVEEAHRRGIRIILDYVPNHTSDLHPWFVESRSSRENPKRDWYIWADPKPDGSPPNNWLSSFGGSAWEFDGKTGQYYHHAYLKEQPDLNWRNPEVQEAMLGVLRFWLERGVDGFRVDALRRLVKDERLRDDPPNPDYREGQNPYDAFIPLYSSDRPETHEMVRMMREVLDGYGERLLIGELYLPIESLVAYYGSGVDLPFNFHLIFTPWRADAVYSLVKEYEAALPPGAWPNWVLGNHDRPRVASRVGEGQVRLAAMLLLTLRGTPTLYYGDEIGMHDVPVPPGRIQDPFGKSFPQLGRDPARTPMQWDDSENAGFTAGEPWLPLAEDYEEVNVARQRKDPRSLLNLYRRLIALRRSEGALSTGDYASLGIDGDLLYYAREHEGRRLLVVLNLGSDVQSTTARGRIVLSTGLDREGEEVSGRLTLAGGEGVILRSSG